MTTTPDAPLESWALSRLLITASRLVERDIAHQMRPLGLTHATFGVLALVQYTPHSQKEIAAATRVEEQTISQTVDKLERMHMVTRERDPEDRRRFLITVTEVGRQAFAHATRQDHAEQALTGLPEAEALRVGLSTLIQRLGGQDYVPVQ